MNTKAGFSLVESIVVIAIISILTVLALTAVPKLRAQQELITDTENLREMLLDAKQRAVNQIRPAGCMAHLDVNDPARAKCSDVGIAYQYGDIIMYANIYDNSNLYRYNPTQDYEIARRNVVSTVSTTSPFVSLTSMLFVGTPPTISTYVNGNYLADEDDTGEIYLTASDGTTRKIIIHSLGTIDVEYEH